MANIRKTFNFRNGVQVDDDNLIVNPLGLVGIGTTIPTEALDVRGTAKVVGLVTADQVYTPSLTAVSANITNLTLGQSIIGGGVSISSGIVTSSGSGVVTYYGDGGRLLNLPTSQWIDTDVGLGFTSIYARGFVGVATDDPRFALQIGGNNVVASFTSGVGINSVGDIVATGIVTANKFSGIGSNLTLINADNISSGTISTDRIPQLPNSKLPNNINLSGIITASGGFSGNLTGNLTGNVTGNLTGNVTGIASTARTLTGNPDILVNNITATSIAVTSIGSTNINVSGIVTTRSLHVGTSGTAISLTSSGRIGIGSAIPNRDIQILKTGTSSVEFIGSTESEIIIGQEKTPGVGAGNSTAIIKFGVPERSFSLINADSGDFSCYLHATPPVAGIETGSFKWIYSQTNSTLMSLTYGGRLGIGKTDPERTLHVVGTSTITGNAWFGGDVRILGNLDISAGSITLPPIFQGNVFTTSGISTFNRIETSGDITTGIGNSVGIGTSVPAAALDVRERTALIGFLGVGTSRLYGNESLAVGGTLLVTTGGVGIGTTEINTSSVPYGEVQIYNKTIDLNDSAINIKNDGAIGFNTYSPRSVFDFGQVGSATTRPVMIFPNITSATRNGIGETPAGAVIFNTSTLKFQGYTGVAWTDFH